MQELDKPFEKDKNDLWYLDSKNIKITPFKFTDINRPYEERAQFFKVSGISDYIIKDTTLFPFFFNGTRTVNNLKKLHSKQEFLPNIDFPIGYYKDKGEIKGTIIPFYKNSMSLREFIALHILGELDDFYYRDPNEADNLIALLLDILELISSMYEQGISYIDIHTGNFLFYKNGIKVIDFEPGYVYFKDKNHKLYAKILKRYITLVEKICASMGFDKLYIAPGDTFMETEKNVKSLRKRLEK